MIILIFFFYFISIRSDWLWLLCLLLKSSVISCCRSFFKLSLMKRWHNVISLILSLFMIIKSIHIRHWRWAMTSHIFFWRSSFIPILSSFNWLVNWIHLDLLSDFFLMKVIILIELLLSLISIRFLFLLNLLMLFTNWVYDFREISMLIKISVK